MTIPKPILLCILDGWGHSDSVENNAIAQANTPHWDRLWNEYPHSLIDASAQAVGLPDGQMGNSEVGHTNIGAGRVVMQDLPKIDKSITDGELAHHPRLREFIERLKVTGGTAHLMGLVSDGGVHSHLDHIKALAEIVSSKGVPVALHAFLDGRDTPPKSALNYLSQLHSPLAGESNPDKDLVGGKVDALNSPPTESLRSSTPPQGGSVKVATVSGRYFAMDRDNRWERIEKAFNAIVKGETPTRAPDALQAIETAYTLGQTDEFVAPVALDDYAGMADGDGLFMTNFRADRARQILHSLIDPDFSEFTRPALSFVDVIGLTEYSSTLAQWMVPLFPPEELQNSLGEVVSAKGLKQLRIAETEKYAHVTFFFNGGSEAVYDGEDRILVPSPKVATYDLQPEMSAPEVTAKLVEAIESGSYDLIICNYANTDMVGHSGDLQAAMKAVEAVDDALGKLHAAIDAAGGAMLVTADHGNAEQMSDPTSDQPHTAHTTNLVPLVIAGVGEAALKDGVLADIAPTILHLMQIEQPEEMTGHCLIK